MPGPPGPIDGQSEHQRYRPVPAGSVPQDARDADALVVALKGGVKLQFQGRAFAALEAEEVRLSGDVTHQEAGRRAGRRQFHAIPLQRGHAPALPVARQHQPVSGAGHEAIPCSPHVRNRARLGDEHGGHVQDGAGGGSQVVRLHVVKPHLAAHAPEKRVDGRRLQRLGRADDHFLELPIMRADVEVGGLRPKGRSVLIGQVYVDRVIAPLCALDFAGPAPSPHQERPGRLLVQLNHLAGAAPSRRSGIQAVHGGAAAVAPGAGRHVVSLLVRLPARGRALVDLLEPRVGEQIGALEVPRPQNLDNRFHGSRPPGGQNRQCKAGHRQQAHRSGSFPIAGLADT